MFSILFVTCSKNYEAVLSSFFSEHFLDLREEKCLVSSLSTPVYYKFGKKMVGPHFQIIFTRHFVLIFRVHYCHNPMYTLHLTQNCTSMYCTSSPLKVNSMGTEFNPRMILLSGLAENFLALLYRKEIG